MFLFFVLLLSFFHFAQCAKQNDEMYQNFDGNFYVYTSSSVKSFDPTKPNAVFKAISNTGTTKYGDCVFLRDKAALRHYVFCTDTTNNKILVYDADQGTLISTAPASGNKPLHIFANAWRDEVWSHIDGSGAADVFSPIDPSTPVKQAVKLRTTSVSVKLFNYH